MTEHDTEQDAPRCTLAEIRYVKKIAEYWAVDKDGEPDYCTGADDEGCADPCDCNFDCYECLSCNVTFPDWAQAVAHVAAGGAEIAA
jgi:hypothetical protein